MSALAPIFELIRQDGGEILRAHYDDAGSWRVTYRATDGQVREVRCSDAR